MTDDDIDKDLLIPEESGPKKKIVKKAKPAIEGINSPKTTRSTVVVRTSKSDEREEMNGFGPASTRLIPDDRKKSNYHLGRWFGILIILLVLVAAGYEAYIWNINRNVETIPGYTSVNLDNPVASSTPVVDPYQPEASSTPATSTPVIIPATTLTINTTPTGYLNVRATPSSSAKQLAQVHPGETYPYTATQSGWYKITLTDGSEGWVSGQYITVVK